MRGLLLATTLWLVPLATFATAWGRSWWLIPAASTSALGLIVIISWIVQPVGCSLLVLRSGLTSAILVLIIVLRAIIVAPRIGWLVPLLLHALALHCLVCRVLLVHILRDWALVASVISWLRSVVPNLLRLVLVAETFLRLRNPMKLMLIVLRVVMAFIGLMLLWIFVIACSRLHLLVSTFLQYVRLVILFSLVTHELLVNILVSLMRIWLSPVVLLASAERFSLVILLPLLATSTVPLTMLGHRMLLVIYRRWTTSSTSNRTLLVLWDLLMRLVAPVVGIQGWRAPSLPSLHSLKTWLLLLLPSLTLEGRLLLLSLLLCFLLLEKVI